MNLTSPTPPSYPLDGWRAAENFAAWHMVHALGFTDATLTALGTDGGLDILAEDAAGQVKHYVQTVGRPDLQRLRGACLPDRTPVFYALSGYTTGARSFAETVDLPLFTYTVQGTCHPVNAAARELVETAGTRSEEIAGRRQAEAGALAAQERARAQAQAEADRAQEELRQAWVAAIDELPRTPSGLEERLDALDALSITPTLLELARGRQWGTLATLAEDSVRGAFQSARLAQARAVHLASGVRPTMDSTEYAPMAARRALEALDELAEQCRNPEPDEAAIGRLIEANGRRFVAITLDARRKISPRR